MDYSNLTALIADDEAHMRTFLRLLLTDIGIGKIYLMQNGMDAIEAYQEFQPDLVLLDINMGKMNGVDALKRIRSVDPKARVIMLTAVATRTTIEETAHSGATYYVLKTQPPDDIKALVLKVLEKTLAIKAKPVAEAKPAEKVEDAKPAARSQAPAPRINAPTTRLNAPAETPATAGAGGRSEPEEPAAPAAPPPRRKARRSSSWF